MNRRHREFPNRVATTAGCFLLISFSILTATTGAEDPPTLDGIWRSKGYDLVLKIDGDRLTLLETNSVCCLKVEEGDRAVLERRIGTLQPGADGQHLRSQDDTSIAPLVWERIERLPETHLLTVGKKTHDPLLAFDIVWHTFDDNYAFFKLRGVDWRSLGDQYRGQLSDKSTDAELFDVLARMLAALGDNHVELVAEGLDFEPYRSLPDAPLVRMWRKQYETGSRNVDLLTFVRGKYREYVATSARLIAGQMPAGASRGADEKLMWGLLPDGVGYLGIFGMAGFVSDEEADTSQHLAALDAALDRAMRDLAEARAMIVDVRFNGGGWDPAAVRIANRFADRRRAAFTKKARTADGFTPDYTVYVQPAGLQQFTRPVMLLTSPMTASAAEIFVFCMNVLPHVQQAGMPTMGIHSDQLVRHLPNGWSFSLSNEVYAAVDGKVYEKVGIPPAVPIAMFSVDDFGGHKDSVVEEARKTLRRATEAD